MAKPIEPPLCPSCMKQRLVYVDLTKCPACAAVLVWDEGNALSWLEARIVEYEARLKALVANRPRAFGLALLAELDLVALNREGPGIQPEYRIWTIMDAFGRRLVPTGDGSRTVAEKDIGEFTQAALDLAALKEAKYSIPQKEADFVDGANVKTQPNVPKYGFGPPIPLRRFDRWWTAWTNTHFGHGPLAKYEPDYATAVGEERDDASIFTLARRLAPDVSGALLAINGQTERQTIKRYAPEILSNLHKVAKAAIEELDPVDHLCDALEKNAKDPTMHQGGPDAPAVKVDAHRLRDHLQANDASSALPRVTAGNPNALFPMLVPVQDGFLYSPNIVIGFHRLVISYRKLAGGHQLGKTASTAYETLISRILAESGMQTKVSGTELTAVSLTASGVDDVDVLAWDARRISLIEVKFEAEPPGAWTLENVKKRHAELAKHWKKIEAKRLAWEKRLNDPAPRIWKEIGRAHV